MNRYLAYIFLFNLVTYSFADSTKTDTISLEPDSQSVDMLWPRDNFFSFPGFSSSIFNNSLFSSCNNPLAALDGGINRKLNIDVHEKNVIVTANIPGSDNSKIDVKVENNIITVEGEMKIINTVKDSSGNVISSSSQMSMFKSSQKIPVEVESVVSDMNYENGLLSIQLERKL